MAEKAPRMLERSPFGGSFVTYINKTVVFTSAFPREQSLYCLTTPSYFARLYLEVCSTLIPDALSDKTAELW